VSSFPTALPEPDITPLRGGPVLRWGVMGPGGIAGSFVRSLQAETDQRIVAVGSRALERAEEFAGRHGIERAYGGYEEVATDPDVDIVYVSTPHTGHRDLALMAIAAGKHVLVEKPIGVSLDDAREIADAARSAGVFAMEAMWSRFLPQTSVISQLLRDDVLGDLRLVTVDFSALFPYDPGNRLFDPALGGGVMLDLGVYTAWFCNFVLGEPLSVTAIGSLAPTGVDAQAVVTLGYEGDEQAVFTAGGFAVGTQSAVITGHEARIEVDRFWRPSGFTLIAGDRRLRYDDPYGPEWDHGLAYQAAAVAADIAEGRTESSLHSLDDTMAIMRVLEESRLQLGAA
jgi:predicted dehydrogenase